MTRQILGLIKADYDFILYRIPRAIKKSTIYNDTERVDIELSDDVIMKIYEDGIILDLGMKKTSIEEGNFNKITIG